MLKYDTFNMGNNITYTTNCKYRTAAKLYTLQMWFVQYVNVKTLHTDDDDDDDDNDDDDDDDNNNNNNINNNNNNNLESRVTR